MAKRLSGSGADAPSLVLAKRFGKSGDDFFIVFDFSEGNGRVGAIREIVGVFQLKKPLLLLLVKFGGLENVSALVKEDHKRGRIGWKRKGLGFFRNGYGIELRTRRCGDFDFRWHAEKANAAFTFLCLFNRKGHLVLPIVVGIAEVKHRGA